MDNVEQYLTQLSFEREIVGGGAVILSRYYEGAGYVWATCLDGGGMPEPDSWHFGAHGAGEDNHDALCQFRSDDPNPMTIEQATEAALVIARLAKP